jgi:hypothetical protein
MSFAASSSTCAFNWMAFGGGIAESPLIEK